MGIGKRFWAWLWRADCRQDHYGQIISTSYGPFGWIRAKVYWPLRRLAGRLGTLGAGVVGGVAAAIATVGTQHVLQGSGEVQRVYVLASEHGDPDALGSPLLCRLDQGVLHPDRVAGNAQDNRVPRPDDRARGDVDMDIRLLCRRAEKAP